MFNPRFLEKCRQLKEAGLEPEFETGVRIGRGFADLGMEVFQILPGGKALSLFTGQISVLNAQSVEDFFLVPSCDEIVDEIVKRGADVEVLEFAEQRRWVLRLFILRNSGRIEFRAESLEEVLAEGLLEILRREPREKIPRAKPSG